jgi:hypothetical protein
LPRNKITRSYTLSQSSIEYIEGFAEEHGLSKTAALEKIIDEHRSGAASVADTLSEAVVNKLDAKWGNIFTRIRLASTMADRNIEVLMEVINTLLYRLNVSGSILTTQSKHSVLQDGETEVKRRVELLKQKKDHRGG